MARQYKRGKAFGLQLGIAASKTLDEIIFPALVSPKLDGFAVALGKERVSATKTDIKVGRSALTKTYTRSGLHIPNHFVRAKLDTLPEGLHGEIICGDGKSFSETASGIARLDGEPENWTFAVFNYFGDGSAEYCDLPYEQRMADAQAYVSSAGLPWLKIVEQTEVRDKEQLLNLIEQHVLEGYEGSMITYGHAKYVWGRCNSSSPWLWKCKAMAQEEFRIIGYHLETYGETEANIAAGLVGTTKPFIASFICKGRPDLGLPEDFRAPLLGSQAYQEELYLIRDELIGQVASVKYMAVGNVSRPRQPRCAGIRPKWDLPV